MALKFMKNPHFRIILATAAAIATLPLFSYAQSAQTPPTPPTPMPASASIREQMRADYQSRMQNAQNNEGYRNVILEQRYGSTTTTQADAGNHIENRHGDAQGLFHSRRDILARQLQTALNNLIEVRARIDARIQTEQQAGTDMSAAASLLATADASISRAQNDITALASYSPSATSTASASTTIDLSTARELALTAQTDIRDAQNDLRSVVLSIAEAMGTKIDGDATATASSTASE